MQARTVWVIEAMFSDRPDRWEGAGSEVDLFLLKKDAEKAARELRSEFPGGLKFRVTKYIPTPDPQ